MILLRSEPSANLWKEHCKLLDAMNSSDSEHDHRRLCLELRGFRKAMTTLGITWACESDWHVMEQVGEDEPMCCGELLNWKPKKPTRKDGSTAYAKR